MRSKPCSKTPLAWTFGDEKKGCARAPVLTVVCGARLLRMAQQNGNATDCQSNCCYPIAMLALLTLLSLVEPLQVAQQNHECTSLATDCQSNHCCYPVAMLATMSLFALYWTSLAPLIPQILFSTKPNKYCPPLDFPDSALRYAELPCTFPKPTRRTQEYP